MGTVNDKIKNVIRNWLEIQPSVGDTITIQETNTFEGNCFRNLLWYRGDASELHQYYTQTDDLMGNAKFWAAQSTTGINIRKIHTGLPSMIVDMLADIIVDSFNKIEVKGNNEAQTNWEEIAKENDFKETLKQAIIDVFVQCDGAFKISYDTDISKYPIIEFYSGQDVDYEYTRGRITGINFKNKYPKKDVPIGDVIMKVDGLSDGKAFSDVSFELHRGEILGIAGLEGCGKNEVIRAIFGKNHYSSGTIEINHKTYPNRIHSAMERGIAFVPAERKVEGLFLKQDIAWNTTIASLKRICKMNTLSKKEEMKRTELYIQQLHTKTNGPKQSVSALSGGNQQKVMLSRWIMTEADVFLLEEPTRGIDVGAKTEVYEAIGDCVKNQKGVVVVSSEEEEVLGICDRVIVMKNGRIAAILNAKTATTEEIKHYAV